MASQVINGSSSGSRTNAPTQAEINAIVQAKADKKAESLSEAKRVANSNFSDLSKLSSLKDIANNNTPTVPTYMTNVGATTNSGSASTTLKGADPNYSNYDQYRTSTDVSWAKNSDNALAQKMYQNVYGTNTGYTGGSTGSTGSTGYNDYYSQLLDLFTNTNEQARQNQINAILSNLSATKSAYKNRIQQVMDEYDSLINQNEVNKYRARKSIRENQANRGQLNSGMGRQEQLQMNMNYDNNANQLNTARQNAINEIYNLITQAEAEAENNKATVNNTYANALLQYQLANQ